MDWKRPFLCGCGGQDWEQWEFRLEISRDFLPLIMVKHWNRLGLKSGRRENDQLYPEDLGCTCYYGHPTCQMERLSRHCKEMRDLCWFTLSSDSYCPFLRSKQQCKAARPSYIWDLTTHVAIESATFASSTTHYLLVWDRLLADGVGCDINSFSQFSKWGDPLPRPS